MQKILKTIDPINIALPWTSLLEDFEASVVFPWFTSRIGLIIGFTVASYVVSIVACNEGFVTDVDLNKADIKCSIVGLIVVADVGWIEGGNDGFVGDVDGNKVGAAEGTSDGDVACDAVGKVNVRVVGFCVASVVGN